MSRCLVDFTADAAVLLSSAQEGQLILLHALSCELDVAVFSEGFHFMGFDFDPYVDHISEPVALSKELSAPQCFPHILSQIIPIHVWKVLFSLQFHHVKVQPQSVHQHWKYIRVSFGLLVDFTTTVSVCVMSVKCIDIFTYVCPSFTKKIESTWEQHFTLKCDIGGYKYEYKYYT